MGNESNIAGKLIYLKNNSKPSNISVGVWLKIELENSKYIKFKSQSEYWYNCGFIAVYNKTFSVVIELYNLTNNQRKGIIIDVIDTNNDGLIDTGDIFHIYGRVLSGCKIQFCAEGISGNISIQIP